MAEVEFVLADVGEGLTEAVIVEWMVAVGDPVDEHQPVVGVETDKARVDLPSPATGLISWLGGEPGDAIAVGGVLFKVTVDGGAERTAASTSSPPRSGWALAAPATRRLARELGVDLETVDGTGPKGRVTKDDVRAATDGAAPAPAHSSRAVPAPATREPAADRVTKLTGIKRAMARTMTAAWRIPHVTELREIDATRLVEVQRALRADAEQAGVRLAFAPIFAKATIAALREHPILNAVYDADTETLTERGSVDLGIAASTPDGLVVPVIRAAERLSLLELAQEIEALAAAARGRRLTPAQTASGSFTLTNTGAYGGWMGTPVIRPPEVGIAGFGRTRDTAAVVDGEIVVRPTLPLSVSADHRVVEGAELSAFISTVERLLVEPARLLMSAP